MAKVFILGASGLFGTALVPYLHKAGHKVVTQSRNASAHHIFDPSDQDALGAALQIESPDVIINLVAATNVDRCEEYPSEAFRANVQVVEALTSAMQTRLSDYRANLIQVSSDHVYDGLGPHRENQALPCNMYALTKFAGELVAERVGATVIRTNFIGRSHCPHRTSLSDWIVKSLRAGNPITVFNDVQFSAWHFTSLSALILKVIANPLPGVFNAGCCDGMSKADFAFRLADVLGLDTGFMKIGPSSEVSFKARRPLDMRMDVSRTERAFGFNAPTMDQAIEMTAEEYLNV